MAVFGIGAILLLLFLLGCTLAVIIATGAALVHGRFALAAVIAGGSFLFVIAAAVFIGLFAAISTRPSVVMTEPQVFTSSIESPPTQWVDSGSIPQITVSHTAQGHSWRINLFPAILVFGLGAFLLARFARHHFAHTAGHHRSWPVVAAFVIVVVLIFTGLRSTRENEQKAAKVAAQVNEQLRAQTEALAKQQQDLAKRAAQMSKDIHQRIDKTNIMQLMDEFDAPRIVLQAPFATVPSPAAVMFAAAPTALQSIKDAAAGDAPSSASQSPDHTQSKSKKKARSKSASSASKLANDNKEPPVAPASPTPPSPPAPTATPPVAEAPAPAAETFNGEEPGDDSLKASKTSALPPASAWHIRSHASGRPAWIDNPPKRTGDVRREVIVTEPYSTAQECYRAADISLMLKAYDRLQELEGNPSPYPTSGDSETLPISFIGDKIKLGGQTLWNGTNWNDYRLLSLNAMGIDPDFLRREVVAKDSKENESCEYIETVDSSAGPMKKLYVQVEFTPAVDRELTRRWDAFHRRAHFKVVGLSAFSIFGLLSIAWGLLKVDTATKGYYTKWLFVGAPIAIMGAAALTLLAYMSLRS